VLRHRVFIQYCRVYVWGVFLVFYFAGLGAFLATDTYELHNILGFVLLGGAGVMFLLTLMLRFPGNLQRMTFQLLLMNGLMLLTGVIGEETPQELNWQRGLGAFHAVLAVGTYILASVIVRRAATVFRIKRPTTLYMIVSRLLKGRGVASAPSDSGSGTRA
jgi:hypothetical protein